MPTAIRGLPVTDLSEPIMFSDPFPRYAELRRTAPVSWVRHQQGTRMEGYMLTRYQDVMALHTDDRFSSDPHKTKHGRYLRLLPPMLQMLNDSMVFKDDPDHKRLRGLVNKAFTPKRVQQMSDDIERMATEIVDGLASKGTVELVEDLAIPLPLNVISQMLGVGDADRDRFHTWIKQFTNASASGSAGAMLRGLPVARNMMKMLGRLAQERRDHPDGGMVSALVQPDEEGEVLSEREVIGMLFLLLLAGHDTTANLLGSSVLTLLDHPDQLERLRADPRLIDTAVEELLRFTTPVPCGVIRRVQDDIELSGVEIPKGSSVIGMIISANRDEEVFDAPEQLDLGRQPNKHITFAFGSHYCLGNQLARLEGRAALRALVERYDDIRLAVPRDQLEWKATQTLRGLRSLPLTLA
jgi:cytochrome P450 PksS